MTTNITEEHRRAFAALASGEHDSFAQFSRFCGGCPAAAIVAVSRRPPAEQGGEPEFELRPLFVSITGDMVLTDHDGHEA